MPSIFDRLLRRSKKTQVEGSNKGRGDDDDIYETSSPLSGIGPAIFQDVCQAPSDGVDIVFVHGLRGDRVKTWSAGDVCWPRDYLGQDLEQEEIRSRIITWGYDSMIANLLSYTSRESIFGHAETLLGDLERLLVETKNRPIIFVGHSLGGLVIKAALIKSAEYHSHDRFPGLAEIYKNTLGVVFIGTPHSGSGKETYGEVLQTLATLSFRKPNKQLLRTLKTDSGVLDSQRNDFTTISRNMSIFCVREELPTAIGMIVPIRSASYEGFNVRNSAIRANHMDMVKFASRNDASGGYMRVLGHIASILREKQPLSVNSISNTGEAEDEVLRMLSFEAMNQREDIIDREHPESCSWFWSVTTHSTNDVSTDGQEFLSWLSHGSGVLWVSGKAACGKSTLMKYLARHERTAEALKKWCPSPLLIVAVFYFYDRGNNIQKSREGMIRSLLCQILTTRRDLIQRAFPERFEALHRADNWLAWTQLEKAFITVLKSLGSSKLCLFVDGLDEYRIVDRQEQYTEDDFDMLFDAPGDDAQWGTSRWISDGHREVADLFHRISDYENIKICLSSRELSAFEQRFSVFPRIRVHIYTTGPISAYCDARLKKEASDIEDRTRLVSEITDKAQGVFLWVRLVVDMLVQGHADGNDLSKILDSVPKRLGGRQGLYARMLETIKPDYVDEAAHLFKLVLRAVNPLEPITLLLTEQGHMNGDVVRAVEDPMFRTHEIAIHPQVERLKKRLRSRCVGLLEADSGMVTFMHQTAKEYLTRDYVWTSFFNTTRPESHTSSLEDLPLTLDLLSGCIRRLKLFKETRLVPMRAEALHEDVYVLISDAMYYASESDKLGEGLQAYMTLLEELDKTGKYIFLTRHARYSIGGDDIKNQPQLKDDLPWPTLEPMESGRLVRQHFLHYAIQAGLVSFVKYKVEEMRAHQQYAEIQSLLSLFLIGPISGIELLQFVGVHFVAFSRKVPDPRSAEILLEAGADPNGLYQSPGSTDHGMINEFHIAQGCTIWEAVLSEGYLLFKGKCIKEDRSYCTKEENSQNKDSNRRRWVELARLFIQHGAKRQGKFRVNKSGDSRRSSVTEENPANMEGEERVQDIIRDIASYSGPKYSKCFKEIEELVSEDLQ